MKKDWLHFKKAIGRYQDLADLENLE